MLRIVLQELPGRRTEGLEEIVEKNFLLGHFLLGMLRHPQIFPVRLLSDSPEGGFAVCRIDDLSVLFHPFPYAAYIFSISSPNFWLTTRRLSFIVGVSSPSSMESSRGRITNFLICS